MTLPFGKSCLICSAKSFTFFYPSYTNAELERLVYQPSRVQDVHDGYDRKKRCVKIADVWDIKKVWEAIYEDNRKLGNFTSKKSNLNSSCRIFYSQ